MSADPYPPVFFNPEFPPPGAVHPIGAPLLLRGFAALADRPVLGIVAKVGDRTLLRGRLNDSREDVLRAYPPARRYDLPRGYQYYVELPAEFGEGVYRIDYFAEPEGGGLVPLGHRDLRLSATDGDVVNPFPDGHFYSPVVNLRELLRDRDRVWPKDPAVLGVDFRRDAQLRFLTEECPKYLGEFDYPFDPPPGAPEYAFRLNNPVFAPVDAKTLFVMLRSLRPATMIEVGSGFSSLLVADVNRRFLGGRLAFTCIEPYPRPFLRDGIPGLARVIDRRVQEVPLGEYDALGPGDVLFIDSSHVAKTGSDVNHLFFEVIPRLKAGVVIHVHDIFLPHDYPPWRVLAEKLSWTEQYVLRALLMFTDAFEVLFGVGYAEHHFPDRMRDIVHQGTWSVGASFWFRKTR
jgi:hypothetical protein